MERTDKKISAAEIAEPGEEAKLLEKAQVDKVAGGDGWDPDKCPMCGSKGGLTVTYKQKTTQYGDLIDVRVVSCCYCGYHDEIPQYC